MPNATRGTPPTRDPVSHGRAFVEGGPILTTLGVIVAWAVTCVPMEIPVYVQNAITGFVVALGTLCFSEWRNRQYARELILGRSPVALAVIPLFAVLFVACASFDGGTYKRLAGDEIARLAAQPDTDPIAWETCDKLAQGAVALRNEEGDSNSLKLPFFAGQHIDELAYRHERIAAICFEMERRDHDRGVEPANRANLRRAWVRSWSNGRALLGGPEEE